MAIRSGRALSGTITLERRGGVGIWYSHLFARRGNDATKGLRVTLRRVASGGAAGEDACATRLVCSEALARQRRPLHPGIREKFRDGREIAARSDRADVPSDRLIRAYLSTDEARQALMDTSASPNPAGVRQVMEAATQRLHPNASVMQGDATRRSGRVLR